MAAFESSSWLVEKIGRHLTTISRISSRRMSLLENFAYTRVVHFGNSRKLHPIFIGQFEILKRIGKVFYYLALLPTLEKERNVFHVSQLKRYVRGETHIVDYLKLKIRPSFSFLEQSIAIIDRREKTLKNKIILLMLVKCPTNHSVNRWKVQHRIINR